MQNVPTAAANMSNKMLRDAQKIAPRTSAPLRMVHHLWLRIHANQAIGLSVGRLAIA